MEYIAFDNIIMHVERDVESISRKLYYYTSDVSILLFTAVSLFTLISFTRVKVAYDSTYPVATYNAGRKCSRIQLYKKHLIVFNLIGI